MIGTGGCPECIFSTPGLTVQQAYSIDKKLDDGLPITGNVVAAYLNSNNFMWGTTGLGNVPPPTGATAGSPTSCFDNGNSGGAQQQYSLSQNNGVGVNCPLSFRLQ